MPKYRCVRAFGLLEPGDEVELPGDASPEFFERLPDPPPDPTKPAAPAAPAATTPAKGM